MKIIQPSYQIMAYTSDLTKLIEKAGRVCYKSEDRICDGSDIKIIEHLKGLHHESVLEHGSITVKFITDRGVSHEIVRHRIASYSQESTRYVNYAKGKFGSEISVIEPFFYVGRDNEYNNWKILCENAENVYLSLLSYGSKPQEARSVLPNSLKTEIVVTANPREWRHFFTMRTSNAAHPQIRQIFCPCLQSFRDKWNVLFNDVGSVDHTCPAIETFELND